MGTSILTDAENHRPMEWDVRNGVIIRKARAHGLPHRSATSWCRCWPRRATGRLD
ncbi:ketopantoate reductase C-terminal domain-containing protein [Mycobacterium paraintracellulare]